MKNINIALILPARNEAETLPKVLQSIPPIINNIIVVDNGSTDETANIAKKYGSTVIFEKRAGYGMACLAGINSLMENPPDVIAFADADGSDDISKIYEILSPIIKGTADLVLEKRIPVNKNALTFQQRFGNALAIYLIYLIWKFKYQDLGPMRAMKWQTLLNLNMKDRNFGWTIEMQIKALKYGLRVLEIPLPYHMRTGGKSKISRTIKGTIKAGFKILWVIFREAMTGKKFYKINQPANQQ